MTPTPGADGCLPRWYTRCPSVHKYTTRCKPDQMCRCGKAGDGQRRGQRKPERLVEAVSDVTPGSAPAGEVAPAATQDSGKPETRNA